MAQNYGPRISNSGLVLNLDAADINSYPGSGTQWLDVSGKNDSSGNRYVSNGGNFQQSAGGGGFALFSGTASTIASSPLLNTDFHSIFMIIRFKQVNGNAGVNGSWSKFFTYNPAGTDRSPGVWRYPSNRIIHWRYDPGNSGCDFLDSFGTGGEFALDRDYFVGVTKNGSTGTPYVNGVQVPIYGGGAVSFPKTPGNATVILFEDYQSGMMEIKNCLIYDRPLTSTEVLQNYNVIRTRLRT